VLVESAIPPRVTSVMKILRLLIRVRDEWAPPLGWEGRWRCQHPRAVPQTQGGLRHYMDGYKKFSRNLRI